jgi:pyridoxal phosphate enzyme (YggS family)
MSEILPGLASVKENIELAARRARREPAEIELVAVSKTHPPDAIHQAIDAGQLLFGESRVQEARLKIPLLPERARWHFIGHLQRNKIRQALPLFDLFHGVDSLQLAREMDRAAKELALYPRILLEVNMAGETSKFGFSPEAVRRDLTDILKLERVQVDGLMTLPPVAEEPEGSRRFFAALWELRDELQAAAGVRLKHLSMGMSQDYTVAVEEGATLVRVGTAIFGARGMARWEPAEGG